MALALGPVLLLTVVGAAVFGGMDVRKKKKKNGAPPPLPTGEPDDEEPQIVTCANVIDSNANGSLISINGGAWVGGQTVDFDLQTLQAQKPMVAFIMCESDPMVVQAIEQLCMQQPGITFYGAYVDRFPDGPIKQGAQKNCVDYNALVAFSVATPISGDVLRKYSSDDIPELLLSPGGNIAQVFANVLAAASGTDDPRAEDWTRAELEES